MGKILSEQQVYDRYDTSINSVMIEWATPNSTAAENLKEQDPTQYDCGFADFTSWLEEGGYEIEWEWEGCDTCSPAYQYIQESLTDQAIKPKVKD